MKLEFFDVGHGACALLTAGDRHVMFDCASSTEFDFFPGDMLEERGVAFLDLLVITNYDEDHARGLPNLLKKVKVGRLMVNRGVTPDQIDDLKGFEPGDGIRAAIDMAKRYNDYSTKMDPIPNVSWTTYSHAYGAHGLTDENNLSLVLLLNLGGVGGANILFTGDMECDGMEALLNANAGLCASLKDVHVYVAPHHGRDSGRCDRVFTQHGCKPKVVVISDKGYEHESQKTVPWYRDKVKAGAGGWVLVGETDPSYVLSTRDRGNIAIDVTPNPEGGWFMGIT